MTQPTILAGRYQLGTVLGRGGMGVVYAAHDDILGRAVAVKVLHIDHAPPQALERFRREAQVLAGLAHPNIVTIYDFGTDESRAWIVMELLPGPSLDRLLASTGPLPVDQVATYGAECAAALAVAHAAGVVHRDVKPANVMLAADGHCTLLDLGIARLADAAAAAASTLTQTGMIVGSVPFLAPEVVRGEPVTAAADMYALGGLLFTLLTGQAPYDAETPLATMAQHVNAPVPHPSQLRPDVPPALDALVVGLLAKEPTDRLDATAAESELRAMSTDAAAAVTEPVAPPTKLLTAPVDLPADVPAGVPEPPAAGLAMARPRTRDRALLLAALAVVAALVVVLLVALVGHNGRPAATSSTPPTATTPTGSSPSPTPTTPSRSPSPTPDSVDAALANLRSAVDRAAASGGLAAGDAQDLQHRIDDLQQSINAQPAGGPGKGPGGPAGDVKHKEDDFAHHLSDLRKQGHLSASAYQSISQALAELRTATSS